MATKFMKNLAASVNKASGKQIASLLGTGTVGTITMGVVAPVDLKTAANLYNVDGNSSSSDPDYLLEDLHFDDPVKYDEMDSMAKNVLNVDFVEGVALSTTLTLASPLHMFRGEIGTRISGPGKEGNAISPNAVVQSISYDGNALIGIVNEDSVQARYHTSLHPSVSAMVLGSISHSGEEDALILESTILATGAILNVKTQHFPHANVLATQYTQAITPHTIAGVEMVHAFGQPTAYSIKIANTTYNDASNDSVVHGVDSNSLDEMMMPDQSTSKRAITSASFGTNGLFSINHFRKLSPQLQIAGEIEHNIAQGSTTFVVASKVDTEFGTFQASASTEGTIQTSTEFKASAIEGLSVNACAGIHYNSMQLGYGVAFKYELGA